MERVKKRWLHKRWTDDVEENLKITGIRNWHIVARSEGMEATVHKRLGGLRRRRQRRKRKKRRRRRRRRRREGE
jgi:hypothetical protein